MIECWGRFSNRYQAVGAWERQEKDSLIWRVLPLPRTDDFKWGLFCWWGGE